jgi:serine protease Do
MMDDNFNYDGNSYGGNYEKQGESSNYPWVYRNGYYSEKTRKNGIRPLHLVIVALLSSILGGGIVFTVFQFITPIVQPSVNSYFSRLVSSDSISSTVANEYVTTKVEYEIKETESPVVAVAEKVGPSIVGIKATARVQDFWFGSMETGGDGSGIIISEDGYILTNDHVIADVLDGDRGTKMLSGAKIEVTLAGDGTKTYEATVVGRDAKTDVAVLKINAKGLTPAELGDSDSLKLGELAVAIGNPGGFTGSVTAGIISGLERSLEVGRQKYTLIQTDAAINPGNSGGALCNSKGQVIGINTVKITAVGFEGLGFAIPINDAKAIFEDLIEYNYVRGRPFLGISADSRFTKDVADRNRVPEGVLVYEVVPLSGAYKAGVKVGDIITEFDGVGIKNYNELVEEITARKPGDTVELKIYRNGETITLQATLEEDKG